MKRVYLAIMLPAVLCTLNGSRFTRSEAVRLKEKGSAVKWRSGKREEHYTLFCVDAPPERTLVALREESVAVYDLKSLLPDYRK